MRHLVAAGALCCLLAAPLASQESASISFDTLWVPGFQAGGIWSVDTGRWLAGGAFRFDVALSLDANRPGASWADRGRWEGFVALGFYVDPLAPFASADFAFTWTAGLSMSFETPRTLAREWLVPYLGFELGGMTTRRGASFLAVPSFGIAIVSYPWLALSAELGATFCASDFSRNLGVVARINLNFVF